MTAQLKPAVPLGHREAFFQDVIDGLSKQSKSLPCKYFYDERGSNLYDQITFVPEYYPTRTESMILADHGSDIAHALGSKAALIEYGSGSSSKTRILLDQLASPACYTPIDISEAYLQQVAKALQRDYKKLPITPIAADFTRDFELPETLMAHQNRVIYFPGSSIGNFTDEEAQNLLRQMRRQGHKLLIGFDLVKCITVLEAAYNDREQLTAAFNLNLLQRINRELDGNFDLDKFYHKAVYNRDRHRIEMHLLSLANQTVTVAGQEIEFKIAESIHTENSHKYSLPQFEQMAENACWKLARTWLDDKRWFAVQLYHAY